MDNLLTIETIIQAIPFAIIVINRDEELVAVNSSASKILGAPVLGSNIVNSIRHPDIVEAIERVFDTGQAQIISWRTSRNRVDLYYDVSVKLIDEDHALLTFDDRTTVEQGLQSRRDFISNVSHELKTPLTAIMGFVETLETVAKDDKDAQARFLAIMKEEVQRMTRLVDGLLSLNHIENNSHLRPTETVDLVQILEQTISNLQPELARNGNIVEFQNPSHSVKISGEHDQLRQVFTNLLENATKYGGPNKPISVVIGEIEDQPPLRTQGVRVAISDHGPGIAHAHLARLTERFYRVDDHRSRQVGGTGLGLSIVKHIVTRHRGRLKISSDLGKGSTFSVILPQ